MILKKVGISTLQINSLNVGTTANSKIVGTHTFRQFFLIFLQPSSH
ncbi:hypothetical protein LMANV2_270022 [Leptospira interrogans serovar Manilae]|uniref:Uncharacterized protein n=1 Tax=Leptospira interrogans serovar Manilae TaxID=214675 RepID=A0AAQ1NYV6_LEPIR|nr:hypothetical protein LMANV2_270022 [Leptospira interrogans serovar Manilae]